MAYLVKVEATGALYCTEPTGGGSIGRYPLTAAALLAIPYISGIHLEVPT